MTFILQCCLLFFPLIMQNAAANSYDNSGSHHSRRYAAYDYDLTTPQYTPDGRLLQVEYAANACIREGSNPIVSLAISIPGDECPVLVMATISSAPSSSSSTIITNPSQNGQGLERQANQRNHKELDSFIKESHQRTQFRIIEVPLAAAYRQSSPQQLVTSTILIGLSGLLSDATSLLQIAYSHLEEEQRMFGWNRLGLSPVGISAADCVPGSAARSIQSSLRKQLQSIAAQPSETVLRLSCAIADKCQKHAFGGGLRPFGASLLLAGTDNARVSMCETYPNGGWRSHVSNVENNDSKVEEYKNADASTKSPQIMVSGGPVKSQYKLKSLIRAQLHQLHQKSIVLASTEDINPWKKSGIGTNENNRFVQAEGKDNGSTFLRDVLISVISSLVEEWGNRGDPLWSSSGTDASKDVQSTCTHQNHGQKQTHLPMMEVVIASPRRGTVRLTQNDIAQLMRPTSYPAQRNLAK